MPYETAARSITTARLTGILLAAALAVGLAPPVSAQEAMARANTVSATEAVDTFEPILSYDTAYNLQLAIAQYQRIVAQGGWVQIPRGVGGLYIGKRDKDVRDLRTFLMQTGDLPSSAGNSNRRFDEEVDLAVRRFQARHGLTIHGGIDEETFLAMSVPAEVRLQQLLINLQRVEDMAPELSERYVVVNIPAGQIEAVQGGSVIG
ncbi:MAG TPA: peptidoglycan-binding protein, partial [Devosiaceae bacterium]|nr:peptidoglycan-binding protein [Devosiaceae bacterium]